jgi:hypothetical protein
VPIGIETLLRQRRRENDDAEGRNDFRESHHKMEIEDNNDAARTEAVFRMENADKNSTDLANSAPQNSSDQK